MNFPWKQQPLESYKRQCIPKGVDDLTTTSHSNKHYP